MARSSPPSGGTDAVRRSLDSHAVAADSADRPYLVAMLRRLGYSDAQIADYVAGRAEPSAPPRPVAVPEPAASSFVEGGESSEMPIAQVASDVGAARDVEVEYTGPGLQDYRLVDAVDFFGSDESEVVEEDPDALVEFGDAPPLQASETDAWGADVGSDGQPLAEFSLAPEESGLSEEAWPQAEAAGPESSEAWPETEAPESKSPDAWPETETPTESSEAWPELDATEETPPAWPETETESQAPVEEPADLWETPSEEAPTDDLANAWAEVPATEEEPAAAPDPPEDETIYYGDYTLYRKDDLRDGQPARVFAFSKTPPGEGFDAATELPEGYQVAENPDTGRPFLRRLGGDEGVPEAASGGPGASTDPARRRVRVKRVRAANREEAMRLIEREGGTALASVPIDIEKRLGDE